jgi:hypothetical protein
MIKYYTQDRETGTKIDWFDSKSQAEHAIRLYEEDDKKNGCFEEDYYEIKEVIE